jgi:dTDP-4-amino-4,6-dideoxyglucose formyltransferase
MRILVISDNDKILTSFRRVLLSEKYQIDFACSFDNAELKNKYSADDWLQSINILKDLHALVNKYSLIISLHCKQIFPEYLVKEVRCINVHPGFNPYNRGWYPHVFSIINGLPCGVTIHEMDKGIDSGPIIAQCKIKINFWETSRIVYDKLLSLELKLLAKNLDIIINNTYKTFKTKRGNINYKKDFLKLCKLDLQSIDTLENHINLLRALTHENHENAYFVIDGKKIFINIYLKPE